MTRNTKHLYMGFSLLICFGALGLSNTVSADCVSDCATQYGVMVPAYTTCKNSCPTATTNAPGNGVVATTCPSGQTRDASKFTCVGTAGPSTESCAAKGMDYDIMTKSCVKNQTKIDTCISSQCQSYEGVEYAACSAKCDADPSYSNTTTDTTAETPVAQGDQTVMGITMGPTCLKNGQCGFSIYKLLGINKSSSATLFVQDILLSATFFIGTVITIALIYSGILFIMAGVNGSSPDKAKKGITNSIIGLLIVITSYSLIRLIQYIAKGL